MSPVVVGVEPQAHAEFAQEVVTAEPTRRKNCPFCKESIAEDAIKCRYCGSMLVPLAGSAGVAFSATTDPNVRDFAGKKLAAGICGILIGALGIHKFILGLTTPGLIMLLVSICTCGFGAIPMGIIGLIEGIIYLTKSDDDFYQLYAVEQKGWF